MRPTRQVQIGKTQVWNDDNEPSWDEDFYLDDGDGTRLGATVLLDEMPPRGGLSYQKL